MNKLSLNLNYQKSRKSRFLFLVFLLCVAVVLTGTAVAQNDDDDPPPDQFPMEHPDYPGVMILDRVESANGVQVIVAIPVLQDAYISSGQPSTNFGNSTSTRVGYNSTNGLNAMRTLLQFDLSAIPANSSISNATFYFYQYQTNPLGDADFGIQAQFMRSPWCEKPGGPINCSSYPPVTWNNANYLGGSIITVGNVNNALGWHTANITQVINVWHSGERPNYGAILTGDESVAQNRSRYFYSRENVTNAPYVAVTYNQQCDTIPPTSSVHPLPQWSPQSFTVTWSGTDSAPSGCSPSGINHFDIDYRINGGTWTRWKSTSGTSGTFSAASNGNFVEFRSRATDNAGNQSAFSGPQASTTVDNVPPNASVNPLPEYSATSGTFTWTGSDNLSGVATYDVQFRINGGAWQNLVQNAPASQTTYQYSGAQEGFYELRARATDNAGNVQPWSENPQAASTVVNPPYSFISVTPTIIKPTDPVTNTFTINWDAFTLSPATIQRVTFYYKYGGSDWIEFHTTTNANSGSIQFDWTTANPGGADGIYYFTSAALDTAARLEALGDPKASGIVDMADAVNPKVYMPAIFND